MSTTMKPYQPKTEPMSKAAQFFFEHAGSSYNPARETPEQGRERCARNLAAAEGIAREAGVSFAWSEDPDVDSSDWRDDCKPYATWECVAYDAAGNACGSLGGIDFGPDGSPYGDNYRRVVEAELAAECVDEILADTNDDA